MSNIATFRRLVTAFPQVTESAHFEKTSFRVGNKIFATLDEATGLICIKLSAKEQSVFCAFDKAVIYPVPNKWGQSGWTFINLKSIKKAMLQDALTMAYATVAPLKLSVMAQQPIAPSAIENKTELPQ